MIAQEQGKQGHLVLEADTTVRAMFFELQKENGLFDTVYSGDFFAYFMDEEQQRKLIETEFDAPAGFHVDTVDTARDFEQIHAVWKYNEIAPPEILRYRIARLPSVSIRTYHGCIAAWELTHAFGQLSHLFTLEQHRGKGLGLLAENLIAQIFVRKGLQVYKFVAEKNVDVVRGTLTHPLWSLWKSVKNGKESDGDEKDIMWTFNKFKYRETELAKTK
ncbi:hypothetical protein PMAYCL1PPCAC_15619 [Pristionchus mayeri]|uniref:Glycine N-acyltransferase-like protein n=1 Tax=Pristionchus mayeri TaxID=1317129 RepID=A0AAN5CJB9_9BILA|nr:hypothetical protein PMAYCL1PPCAC_15619 [Pristionchus mayeri]